MATAYVELSGTVSNSRHSVVHPWNKNAQHVGLPSGTVTRVQWLHSKLRNAALLAKGKLAPVRSGAFPAVTEHPHLECGGSACPVTGRPIGEKFCQVICTKHTA